MKKQNNKLKIFLLLVFVVLMVVTVISALFGKINNDKQVRSLKNQITALKKDNELLKTRYDNYTIEFENLFNEYNKAINELSEQRKIIANLTKERDSGITLCAEYYEQCQTLTEQITTLENEIELLKNEKTTLITEKETLQNTINSNNDKISELNEKISSLNASITEKDKTIVTLRSNISNKNTQIENLNAQIENLNTQITVLQNDITNKETTISDMQKTVTDLNNKIFELEKKIDYTITYTVGEDVTTKTAKGHTTITLLDKPTKTDLTFDGWYYDGNKIETTTFDITNTDISIIGYFKCLVTCGNNTTLVDVGSSLGNNAIIPLGTDGDVYTYYLNGDKTKGYTYDEICSYNFTKNTTITYELTSNTPNIDYSYGGRFSDWSKTDLSSPFNSVQAIQFTFDKTNNGGQCFFDTTSGSYQSTFDIVFDESLKVYCFVTTVNNQFKFTGIFALKRGLSGDNISTLANSQNYAWHFGFGTSLSAVVGENCEFNSNIFALKSLCYIFSANIDGSYDTNMA